MSLAAWGALLSGAPALLCDYADILLYLLPSAALASEEKSDVVLRISTH